jgi:glycosidase
MLRFQYLLLILSVIVFSFTFGCQSNPTPQIHDLIQPVVSYAGKSDTLLMSDLFYAEDYSLEFDSHPNMIVNYNQKSKNLVIKPKNDFEGCTLLGFKLKGKEYQIPIYSRIKQRHVFKFRPERKPSQRMNIMGTFNDWNRNSLPMQDQDGDNVYEIELSLDPGQYLYQFVVDKDEIFDPENPNRVDNGFGSFNSVISVPPRYTDKAFLHILGFDVSNNLTVLKFIYERENQPQRLERKHVIALMNNQEIPDERIRITGNRIDLMLDEEALKDEKVVRIIVTQNGQYTNMQTVRLKDGQPLGADNSTSSWYDAIVYSIMIDRFYDGDKSNSVPVEHDSLSAKVNYMGGDLQGIIQKLETGYFDTLGVNALWLSPVNENTNNAFKEWPPPHRYFSAYHGYWPTHHEKVEERFGDLDLLKTLVAKAHRRGMKVLLDFIANHVHIEHPFYKEHRDWFGTMDLPDGRKNIRLWDEFRLTTWFEPFLPSFDYLGSEAAQAAMTDNAIWWLKQTSIDGFRQDAVKHIPNSFWRTLTNKIKREIEIPENREIYQIGETFGSYKLISSYVKNGQLDAQFNFNLYDVALSVFLTPQVSFSVLSNELQKTFSIYGFNHLMGNLMDNHDKIRYMAYADGDLELNSSEAVEIGWSNPPEVNYESSYEKVKLYLTYLMTIPGVPTLYYGDEIGMSGAADPDNRRMMRFDDELNHLEKKMLSDVSKIIKLRRKHSALRYGDFQTLFANENCFVYLRSDMNERILVALNKSEQAQNITVEFQDFYQTKNAFNIITGQEIAITDDRLSLNISPIGFSVLKIK